MPFRGDVIDHPLLVLRLVIDARRKRRRVVDDVQLVAAVCPRDENNGSGQVSLEL